MKYSFVFSGNHYLYDQLKNTKYFENLSDESEYLDCLPKEIEQLLSELTAMPEKKNVSISQVIALCNKVISQMEEASVQFKFDKKSSLTSFSRVFISSLRIIARINTIRTKLTNHYSVGEAFAPYELGEKSAVRSWGRTTYNHKNIALFSATEIGLNDNFTNLVLEKAKSVIERLNEYFNDGWYDLHNVLCRVSEYKPEVNKFISLIIKYLRKSPQIQKYFEDLLRNIPDGYFASLTNILLNNIENFEFLQKKNLLLVYLEKSKREKEEGSFLINNKMMFEKLFSCVDVSIVFNFIEKLTLENYILPDEISDYPKDYFRVLLMFGFDYKSCLYKLLENMSDNQNRLSLILFEACLRPDFNSVKTILEASARNNVNVQNIIKKTISNNTNGYFNSTKAKQGELKEKEVNKLHTKTTEFNEIISFDLSDFVRYMMQKYALASDKESLYFRNDLPNLAAQLAGLNLILDENSFLQAASKAFQIKLEDPMPVEGWQKRFLGLETLTKEQSKRIKVLEGEVSELKGQMQEVMQTLNSSLLCKKV